MEERTSSTVLEMQVSFTCRLHDTEAIPIVSRVRKEDLQGGAGTMYNASKVGKEEESKAVIRRVAEKMDMTIRQLFAQHFLTSRVSQLLQTLSTPALRVPVSAGDWLAWRAGYPPAL